MMDVVWTQGASSDVLEICERLDGWEEGAGDRFYLDLQAKVSLLEAHPFISHLPW